MVVKVPFAFVSISAIAFFALAVISSDSINAFCFIGAIVPSFAFIDILAFGNSQRGFKPLFTLASVRPDRVDALTPGRTMISAETAFIHVVTSGPVAFKPGIAHTLGIVSGQTSRVRMTDESVAMRTAHSGRVNPAFIAPAVIAIVAVAAATAAVFVTVTVTAMPIVVVTVPVTFRTARPGRRSVTVAVRLVALSLGNGSHMDASAAQIPESTIFSNFQGRLRDAHVADSRPSLPRRLRIRAEFPAAGRTALAVRQSASLRGKSKKRRMIICI